MKTNILRTAVILLFFAGGFISCEKENHPVSANKKWIWTGGNNVTVTLEFYPAEGKFYSTVANNNMYILFADDIWMYYKMINDTLMYVRGENGEFPTEDARYNKWFVFQRTEDILEMEYTGTLPAIPIITHYLFKAQN